LVGRAITRDMVVVDVSLVHRLREPKACMEDYYHTLSSIYQQFIIYDKAFVPRANAYVEAGLISQVYKIAVLSEKSADEERMLVKVLYILGMLCFNNLAVTAKVQMKELMPLLQRATCTSSSTALLQSALYLMCNLTATSFDSHPNMVSLLPRVRAVLEAHRLGEGIRSEAVRVCFYLSANDKNKSALSESGVLLPLTHIMSQRSMELDCTSAGITVANLIENTDKCGPADWEAVSEMAQDLVDCFAACLNGTDFPLGSNLFYRNWKVAKGMSKLAACPAVRKRLREHGLMELLGYALAGDDTDNQMHKHSMDLLWMLSADEAP